MVAGNGSSPADAQHLAAQYVSRLVEDRPAMHAMGPHHLFLNDNIRWPAELSGE